MGLGDNEFIFDIPSLENCTRFCQKATEHLAGGLFGGLKEENTNLGISDINLGITVISLCQNK